MTNRENNNFGMTEKDWQALLHALSQNKCIICVGPGLYAPNENMRLEDELIAHLKEQEERLGIRVYDDGWLHFLGQKAKTWPEIKEFYRQPRPIAEQQLKLIAQIPFNFLISFTPDYKLKEAFEQQGFAYDFKSYIKDKHASQEINLPVREFPLVYNLLGELDEKNSLVLSYDDLYDYFRSHSERYKIPDILRELIEDAEYFIFLGIPFDKWYTHLFMRILKQHKLKDPMKYAANLFVDEKFQTQSAEQYTISFIPSNISLFIEELHRRCTEFSANFVRSKENGRQPNIAYKTLRLQLIEGDNPMEVCRQLLSELSYGGTLAHSLVEQIEGIQSRWHNLQPKARKGLISASDKDVEIRKIEDDLLKLISTIKQTFPN